MQTIYLDISNRGVIPVIYAKQNDVGRKVEVVLTNSGLPYEPEAGSAFSAWYSGASGMGNYTDIGGKSAFAVSGNKVTVELITQMLQNAGEGFLCLVLSRLGGEQIGMWNIRYICEGIPGAGSEPAKDYYTAFSQAVADLPYPDVSLSAPGKAADAAATGKALEDKAPAGFGLGEYAKVLTSADDLDTVQQNGWYRWTEPAPKNAPLIMYTPDYGFMRVDNASNGTFVQTVYSAYSTAKGIVVTRAFAGSTTDGWEWVNPPMVPGKKYRTTERWNGKAVYTMLVDCGTMPNKTDKTVTTTITGNAEIVRFDVVYKNKNGNYMGNPMVDYTTGDIFGRLTITNTGNIAIRTYADVTDVSAMCRVWYTKD